METHIYTLYGKSHQECHYMAKEISIIGGEGERKAFAERKFTRFAISDAAWPLLSLSRPLCFWSPEDNEHNYGRVFVLEITQ